MNANAIQTELINEVLKRKIYLRNEKNQNSMNKLSADAAAAVAAVCVFDEYFISNK